ncbi:MAG TPA: hypothetical protein VHQ92_01070 [Pseudolabrys sp.]|jgi:hypothetical protein|nr:hypothetical protein [Pseudolabrys sp.]
MKRFAMLAALLLAPLAQATQVSDLCSSFSVAANVLTCVPVGGSPPTGCAATINGSGSLSLPSSGGPANLAVASCSGTPTYQWTRNGTNTSTAASYTDSVPNNPGSGAATYSFQVRACNGGACATFPGSPLVATVAGSGGGGGSCPGQGFNKVINLTFNWTSPTRLFTSSQGGMGPNDAAILSFTTGNVTSPTNNLPHIVCAEFSSPPSQRIAVLSAQACDFSAQQWQGATTSGTTVQIPFTVNNPSNFGYYPILKLNTTYYFNLKNQPSPSCASGGNCDVACDLIKPAGLGLSAPQSMSLQDAVDMVRNGGPGGPPALK